MIEPETRSFVLFIVEWTEVKCLVPATLETVALSCLIRVYHRGSDIMALCARQKCINAMTFLVTMNLLEQ